MEKRNSDGVCLYGAGGHCKVVVDILAAINMPVSFIVDDDPKADNYSDIPIIDPVEEYDKAIITIGNCKTRKEISKRIKVKEFVTAIHPSAIISPAAIVGEGTVIVQGAIIQAAAIVGKHCIVNTKASIGHDVILHDYVHIASGATICGGVEIGEGSWIGAGSVVKQGKKIGANCMIGVGSVVVKDIPDNVVAFGNPCRVVRLNNN